MESFAKTGLGVIALSMLPAGAVTLLLSGVMGTLPEDNRRATVLLVVGLATFWACFWLVRGLVRYSAIINKRLALLGFWPLYVLMVMVWFAMFAPLAS